jgi:hypothetical protein
MLKWSLSVAAGIGLYSLLGARGTDGASTGIPHSASDALPDSSASTLDPVWCDIERTACGSDTGMGIEWYCDVAYAPEPAGHRLMDIYLPTEEAPTRTILWIHGKSWKSGSKSDHADVLKELASRGNAVASMDYKLAGPGIGQPSFPLCVQDVLQAISALRTDVGAEFCLPPCIVVLGNSAGAHLASMAATGWDVDYFNPANTTGATCFNDGQPPDVLFRPDLVVTISGTTNLYALGASGYTYHESCKGRDEVTPEDTCHECAWIQEHFDIAAGYSYPPPLDPAPPELLVGINWTPVLGVIHCGSFTLPGNLFLRASAQPYISSIDPPYHAFNALCDSLAFSIDPATMQNTFAVALNAATGTASFELVPDYCQSCRHALGILGDNVGDVVDVIDAKITDRMGALGLCGER